MVNIDSVVQQTILEQCTDITHARNASRAIRGLTQFENEVERSTKLLFQQILFYALYSFYSEDSILYY